MWLLIICLAVAVLVGWIFRPEGWLADAITALAVVFCVVMVFLLLVVVSGTTE